MIKNHGNVELWLAPPLLWGGDPLPVGTPPMHGVQAPWVIAGWSDCSGGQSDPWSWGAFAKVGVRPPAPFLTQPMRTHPSDETD